MPLQQFKLILIKSMPNRLESPLLLVLIVPLLPLQLVQFPPSSLQKLLGSGI